MVSLNGPTDISGEKMSIELISAPAATAARIRMSQGDVVTAEVGAMIAMSPQVVVETTSRSRGGKGGLLKGAAERILAFALGLEQRVLLVDPEEIRLRGERRLERSELGERLLPGTRQRAGGRQEECCVCFVDMHRD